MMTLLNLSEPSVIDSSLNHDPDDLTEPEKSVTIEELSVAYNKRPNALQKSKSDIVCFVRAAVTDNDKPSLHTGQRKTKNYETCP